MRHLVRVNRIGDFSTFGVEKSARKKTETVGSEKVRRMILRIFMIFIDFALGIMI